MKQIGGIYIFNDQPVEDATVFGVYIGRNQVTYLTANTYMCSFYEDVENDSMNHMVHVPNYTFGIKMEDKTWHIKDESANRDKQIIASGSYDGDFDKEVMRFLKQMTGL